MRFLHPKETRLAATMEQIMSLGKTCGVIVILSCYAPLQAASIVIISSTVSVQGRASGNVYSNADGGAISGATGDGSNWRASSSGSMSTSGATLNAVSELLSGRGDGWINSAYSTVTLSSVFQPLSSNLEFQFTGYTESHSWESFIDYTLTDLTTNLLIQSKRWAKETVVWTGGNSLPYSVTYPLNVGHQYRLDLFAKSEIGDFRDGSANLNLTIVPEPMSMLLLAPGLVGLTLRRNRKACLYRFHTNWVSTSSL
jgi:hypothetical protein